MKDEKQRDIENLYLRFEVAHDAKKEICHWTSSRALTRFSKVKS